MLDILSKLKNKIKRIVESGSRVIMRVREYVNYIEENTLVHKSVSTVIFLGKSGVVAGLVLAIASPFFMPWISNFQVNSGLAERPNIQKTFYLYGGNDTIDGYSISLKNENNKIAESVQLTIDFKGCSIGRDVNSDFPLTDIETETAFGRTCFEFVTIRKWRPGQEIFLQYTVNHTQETNYSSPDRGTIIIDGNYLWQFNGRTYTQSFKITCDQDYLEEGGYIVNCNKNRN